MDCQCAFDLCFLVFDLFDIVIVYYSVLLINRKSTQKYTELFVKKVYESVLIKKSYSFLDFITIHLSVYIPLYQKVDNLKFHINT